MPASSGDPIALLLAGRYPDPETGELLHSDTLDVVIADSLDGREAEVLQVHRFGERVAVVSDRNTHAALGARVERVLASAFTVQSVILPAPHADAATVAQLDAAMAPDTHAIVAVGSGTLNDLCKMVASKRRIAQFVFATAPSMNGYTSVSASIISDGVKRSHRTGTPIGAYFDLSVLAAAPKPLIRAGLGDSSARSTAQADWLLSHLLLDRPYREVPFALLADDEAQLFADPAALVAGDTQAMRALVRTLVLSGFGMTLCNGSYPASQGEHLLGHYLEMIHPLDVLHGEQIGVCTIAMADLQERILAWETPPVLRASTITPEELQRAYGDETGAACWSEYERKRVDEARAEQLNARLSVLWDAIRTRIRAISIGHDRIRATLAAAGAATSPQALGYTDADMSRALAHARVLRDRYTFLDLAVDAIA
jgi:glycerol-1-phosphate dehydrogenase [NAD(P)+]